MTGQAVLIPGLTFGKYLIFGVSSGSKGWCSIRNAMNPQEANQAWCHSIHVPLWKTVSVRLAKFGLRVFDISLVSTLRCLDTLALRST